MSNFRVGLRERKLVNPIGGVGGKSTGCGALCGLQWVDETDRVAKAHYADAADLKLRERLNHQPNRLERQLYE